MSDGKSIKPGKNRQVTPTGSTNMSPISTARSGKKDVSSPRKTEKTGSKTHRPSGAADDKKKEKKVTSPRRDNDKSKTTETKQNYHYNNSGSSSKDEKLDSTNMSLPPHSLEDADKEKKLEVVLATLEHELTKDFIVSLSLQLQHSPSFTSLFMKQSGFEKLSFHLAKKSENPLVIHMLTLLYDVLRENPEVFQHLFTQSAVLITTLIWLLVKLRKVDSAITAKVYEILAMIPTLAKKWKLYDYEFPDLLLSSLNLYNQKSQERYRFQHLLVTLEQSPSDELKQSVLKLINTLIQMHEDLEARMSIRLEFISRGLEEILTKITEKAEPYLKALIEAYKESKESDSKAYVEASKHSILKEWLEGKDLNGLVMKLGSKWPPPAQSLLFSTLVHLLYIPNDPGAVTTWITVNKIITAVASHFEVNMVEPQIQGILEEIKKKLDEQDETNKFIRSEAEENTKKLNQKITAQDEEIKKLQNDLGLLQENHSKLLLSQEEKKKAHHDSISELNTTISDLKKQLTHADISLKTEQSKTADKQKMIEDLHLKLATTEKQYHQLVAEEKILRMNLEATESLLSSTTKKTLLSPPTSSTPSNSTVSSSGPSTATSSAFGVFSPSSGNHSITPSNTSSAVSVASPSSGTNHSTAPSNTSTAVGAVSPSSGTGVSSASSNTPSAVGTASPSNAVPLSSFVGSDDTLSPEELRLLKIMNRASISVIPGGGYGAPMRVKSENITKHLPNRLDGAGSPKATRGVAIAVDPPDWKRRQREKEKEEKEKVELEFKKKQEALAHISTHANETASITTPPPIARSSTDKIQTDSEAPTPSLTESMQEKEEKRLERVLHKAQQKRV